MIPLSNTTDRPPVAAHRSAVGGGLRYALISTSVMAAVISVTLIVGAEHSLPRFHVVRDVQAPREDSVVADAPVRAHGLALMPRSMNAAGHVAPRPDDRDCP